MHAVESESVASALARAPDAASAPPPFTWIARPMRARVDPADRDALRTSALWSLGHTLTFLSVGVAIVALDLQGFRSGALNEGLRGARGGHCAARI